MYLSGFFERGSRQGLPRGKSPGDPVDDGSLTIKQELMLLHLEFFGRRPPTKRNTTSALAVPTVESWRRAVFMNYLNNFVAEILANCTPNAGDFGKILQRFRPNGRFGARKRWRERLRDRS